MMRFLFGLLIVLCSGVCAFAAPAMPPLPAEVEKAAGVSVLPTGPSGFTFTDQTKGREPAKWSAATDLDGASGYRVEVAAGSKNPYDVQAQWTNARPVKKGDVMLVRVLARAKSAKQESGEAAIGYVFQRAKAPYEKSVGVAVPAGPEWTLFQMPFTASLDFAPGEAASCLTFGTIAQVVEIAGFEVLNFEHRATADQLPRTQYTYAGREAGATWRAAALKRIDDIRTGPLTVRVTDTTGKPVAGATVQGRLVRPAFNFGTAVNERLLAEDGPDSAKYRQVLRECFDTATIENGLKWGPWMSPTRRPETLRALDWLEQNGLRARGHNLVWPSRNFSPKKFTADPQFAQIIDAAVTAHIEEIVTALKGHVICWDVINEMLHEKDYFDVLPRQRAADWFKQARRIDPGAQLFINEYGMLNGPASPMMIGQYLGLIDELRGYGAPIDAIGVQGHVGELPRGPVAVLSDLDLLDAAKLPIQITEYDCNTADEQLQGDYTRDFLIACYSHPNVTGFTMWGFWQGAHWKPNGGMFRKDWSEKPAAKVWREWVTDKWRTRFSAAADAAGTTTARGHLGRYEVTATHDGKTVTTSVDLAHDGATCTLVLR